MPWFLYEHHFDGLVISASTSSLRPNTAMQEDCAAQQLMLTQL